MAHLREQIREQVVADLTGLTTTGANVFKGRVYPLEASNLPALLIYTDDEEIVLEQRAMGAVRKLFRKVELIVEAQAQGISNAVEDTIDTICKEVEVALASDISLNSLAVDSYLEKTEKVEDGNGKKYAGFVKMTYAVFYRTDENDPENAV
tara:strand:+ start:7654 stop:8106 length:453 start_codon:yes stop_codon:yes gene_type:complete